MGCMFQQNGVVQILDDKGFTYSAELFPPRNGKSPEIIFKKLEKLAALDLGFISITKGAMGSLRGGTIPIGYIISERYHMNALVHFRCRDMDKKEVENLLVDHMYFGTKNILAILGDPLPGEASKHLVPATHNRYACELVKQIADMNAGKYLPLPRNPGQPREGIRTEFCIGVACYPEAEDMEQELFIMHEKVKAGANFAVTQMIFSAEAYSTYVQRIRERGIQIPIIPGIRPVTSMNHVVAAEEIFGANVPDSLKQQLDEVPEDKKHDVCIDFTLDLIRQLKDAGAPGVHMFTMNDVDIIEEIMSKIS